MNFAKPFSLILVVSAVSGTPALAAEETRTVPAFKAVEFSGVGHMDLTAGQEQSVTLSGSKKALEQVVTQVEDGVLKIKFESDRDRHNWLWRFVMPDDHDSDRVDLKIAVPSLTHVGVSGAAQVSAHDLKSEQMEFAVSGAARIRATGRADKLTVNISGAGDADLDHLEVKDAVITIAGAGKAYVNPTDTLTATIAGVGEIRYDGEPHVVSSISGAGSVRSRKK